VAGLTVLLEEVSESIDPALDSIVTKSTFVEEGVTKIKFGDKSLFYDPNFKLLLTTKIANPHFLPEVCIKLTIINFSITFQGL
jgi:dynein heavy chain, axonemal